MKNRLAPTTILFILAIFSFGYAYSQDDRMPDLDSGMKETRQDAGTEILPEGETKIIRPVVAQRDSIQVKPTPKKADGKGKSEDTSVLSFNFLYYLIERFKLSDIVD